MKSPADAGIGVFRRGLGAFDVAAETTRMPMIFTDARSDSNPIVFANGSFLALTGFTRGAILARPLSIILSAMADMEVSGMIEQALSTGDHGTWEMLCQRVDGTDFSATVFLSPVRDRKGRLRQNFLSFIPFSARFGELLKQQNEFHALYETAPGFIATAEGANHRFTFANASYKKFVGRDDLEGLTVAEALPEIAAQGFIEILDQVFLTGVPFQGTAARIDVRDPETGIMTQRYADFVYQPVRAPNGTIVGLFCEGYDVTAQREAAEKLALVQAEMIHVSRVNAMGTMAITLAHELNQPLAAIANYSAGGLRILDPGSPQTEPIARALRAIDHASQRASDIIRTLRELTKRREPARTSFNLALAVDECIRLVGAAAQPNIEIIDLTPDDMMMSADRIQIQQVLINLLRNACDAGAVSGLHNITISAQTRDGSAVVSVADAGPGVSSRAAQNLFSWSDSAKDGGMGLGLSICRTIIEAHQGRIWLDESNNNGSKFCFSVPINLSSKVANGEKDRAFKPA